MIASGDRKSRVYKNHAIIKSKWYIWVSHIINIATITYRAKDAIAHGWCHMTPLLESKLMYLSIRLSQWLFACAIGSTAVCSGDKLMSSDPIDATTNLCYLFARICFKLILIFALSTDILPYSRGFSATVSVSPVVSPHCCNNTQSDTCCFKYNVQYTLLIIMILIFKIWGWNSI